MRSFGPRRHRGLASGVVLLMAAAVLAVAVPAPVRVAAAVDPVIAAAGDIACDPTDVNYNNGLGTASFCRQKATAALLEGRGYDAILPLGDLQYADGTLSKFQTSYDSSWGSTKPLQRPAVGNHEYLDPNAAGYYTYNGATAGDPAKGYYSYNLGSWHIVALNSECAYVGGCGPGSPQETWLRADLAANPASCTLGLLAQAEVHLHRPDQHCPLPGVLGGAVRRQRRCDSQRARAQL